MSTPPGADDRPATVEDLHHAAAAMPHVTVHERDQKPQVYQVGGKSFLFFRTPRPDAVDAATGERLTDVVVLWVASEEEKQVLLADGTLPFFTTSHFDGHPSVLLRVAHVGRLSAAEVREFVADAWLAQASRRRGETWLREQGLSAADGGVGG